ncbi:MULTISPECIES: SMI1/KNR4 family protein [Sorangium]|uniref:Knr4/Smi1-like domain-containing protein n=1 Tax=Sorangium cellulosum TaxID=56 RepID=A0A4P2QYX8_SORCE|nr:MULTISPECIES: SMI1/KNR4 family protein [Sorangium]AUX35518.1 uncharacterized protein SOCE836_077120 [Sorangium cellulosum]
MDKLVTYASTFDPTFPSRIRGAGTEEIERLQDLAGHVLPQDYKEYLSLMGHGDGGALSSTEICTDIAEVIAFYEENVATGEDEVPSDCVVIGVGGVAVQQLYLEHEAQGHVFDGADGEKLRLWSESFEKLLHQQIYMQYRPNQLAHSAFYATSDRAPVFNSARAAAIRLGFAPEWFSDKITFCGERSGTVLVLNQLEGQGLWVRIAAERVEALPTIAQSIAEASGVLLQRSA